MVENTGDEEDTQDIVFEVGGTLEDIETGASIGEGDTYPGTFTYTTVGGDAPEIEAEVSTDDDTESTTVTLEEEHTLTGEELESTGGSKNLTVTSEDGGEVVKPGEDTFEYDDGETVDLEAVPDEGYYFVEWTGDTDTIDDTTANKTEITMDDNYTIKAEFDIITYDLTIDSTEGGGVINPEDGEVVQTVENWTSGHGWDEDIEAVPDEGYHFVEWTGDNETIEDTESNKTVIEMFDDYNITAVFEINVYNLTIDSIEGGNVTEPGEDTFEYEHGTPVNLEVEAEEDYHFTGWTGDTDKIEDPDDIQTTITMEDHYNITAGFTMDTYELNITVIGEGSTDPEEGNYTYYAGEDVNVEAMPDENHYFVNWTGDYEGTEEEITITMDEDKSITAHFQELDQFNLTIEVEGEGSTDPEEGNHTYYDGENVTIEAIPDDNWYFEEWKGDYQGTEEEINITMDEDKSITAHFQELDKFNLTIEVEGEGSTDPEEGNHTYYDGENVTIEAIPEEGWYFEEWKGDYQGTEEEITIMMDEDKTITAHFGEIITYQIEIEIEGEGQVQIDPDQDEYEVDTEVNLEAISEEGWYFEEWTGDVSEDEEEEITVTMDEDKEITAVFKPYEPFFKVEITAYEKNVREGDYVRVQFEVTNTGEAEGTQDIVFRVEGLEEAREEDVNLEVGEEFTEKFFWRADEGSHLLSVSSDDDIHRITLRVDDEPDTTTPGFTSLLLILAAVAAVAIYNKKKRYRND